MRKVILECARDDQTGELGLVIASVKARHPEMNAAQEGLLIAHDLIEHVNGPEQIGTVDDELEALGAIWYTRGQHADLNRDGRGAAYTVEENIASDVVRMYRDVIAGGVDSAFERGPPRRAGRECNAERDLVCILDYAEKNYPGEFDESERSSARKRWAGFRFWALLRMRAGYRKAVKRWEHKGRFAANSQFWAIAEAVQPYAKRAEFEGQRYELRYGNGDAHCDEIYPDEEY